MLSKISQIVIWAFLLGFWIICSADYHPTLFINICVISLLLFSYAAIIYANWLILIPRFYIPGRYVFYWFSLIVSMIILTFIVLTAIRAIYFVLWDPKQVGDYWENYRLDFLGMAIHLLAATSLVWVVGRKRNTSKISSPLYK